MPRAVDIIQCPGKVVEFLSGWDFRAMITATFSLWSASLTHRTITAALGASPDDFAVKGADRSPPRKMPLAHGWHLSVERTVDGDVGLALASLLERVNPIKSGIQKLLIDDKTLDVRTTISIRTDHRLSMYIEEKYIKNLGDLRSSLDIDFLESH